MPPLHASEFAAHFDALASVWAACAQLECPGEAEHVLRLLKPEPRSTGLDLACGGGQLTAGLAAAGGRIHAADLSERMLKLAACRFVERRLNGIVITVQDAHRLEFTAGLFDWAVCRHAWRYFEEPARVLRELARVTRPGARLYVSDWSDPAPALDHLLGALDPAHRRVLDEAWWEEALADLPFETEHRRVRLERLDPGIWGALGGRSEEEARARFEALRPELPQGAQILELDGRPVWIAGRQERVLRRLEGRTR